MRFLSRVTFSGIDQSCDVSKLADFLAANPRVELAVLAHQGHAGIKPRYPTLDWTEQLLHKLPKKQLAIHLCGGYATDVLKQKLKFPAFVTEFNRIQLNVCASLRHVDQSAPTDFRVGIMPNAVRDLVCFLGEQFRGPEVIWQVEDFLSAWLFGAMMHARYVVAAPPPAHLKLSCLFDESSGTGRPMTNPTPFSPFWAGNFLVGAGYAGGISPTNIGWVLHRLLETVYTCTDPKLVNAIRAIPVWIDMESGIRTIHDGVDSFDLKACKKVLDKANLYLLETPCT